MRKNDYQMTINMVAQIMAFVVNMGISFFLTPYIVNNISGEAYGFVGLANTFISIAQVVTVALNSMAGRFVSIAVHQNRHEKAKEYYSSVMMGNLIIMAVFALPMAILVLNLEKIVNISPDILMDVKLLWGLLFINFLVSILYSVYSISTFVKNRIDITSRRTIESHIIRIIILLFIYMILSRKNVWYMGLATLVATLYLLCTHIWVSKKIMPEVTISKVYFRVSAIKRLLVSGGWNVLSRISQLFNTGMDLLLSNIFLGAEIMGMLSVSKTLPTAFNSFTSTVVGVFAPKLTILYAEDKIDEIVEEIKQSVKILTIFCSSFFAFILIYSKIFYQLWTPDEDSNKLYLYTVLAVFHMPITSGMNSIYNIFQITDKVKKSSIALFIISIINICSIVIAVNILDKKTSTYIVAGMSSLLALLVMLFYIIPYAGICIKGNWKTFLSCLGICIGGNIVMVIAFVIVGNIMLTKTWGSLIISSIVSMFFGSAVQLCVFLSKKERKRMLSKLKRKQL